MLSLLAYTSFFSSVSDSGWRSIRQQILEQSFIDGDNDEKDNDKDSDPDNVPADQGSVSKQHVWVGQDWREDLGEFPGFVGF